MKKKKENLFYIILIIVVVVSIIVYKNILKQKERDLSITGETTVGKIINTAFPGRISTSGFSYNYIYYIDNIKYEGGSLDEKKYPEGSYFKVTYLLDKPEESRMEFSKPVSPDSVCTYFNYECPF